MTPLPTHRPPGWEARLSALVAQRHRCGFAIGVHDCCLWAADAVLAIMGVDLARDIRGTYHDAAGAARVLRAIGGLRGAAARAGAPLASPAYAVDGDVGLVRFSGKPLLAVRAGGVWLAQATAGLIGVSDSSAARAWGVGHG